MEINEAFKDLARPTLDNFDIGKTEFPYIFSFIPRILEMDLELWFILFKAG